MNTIVAFILLSAALAVGMYLCYVSGYKKGVEDLTKKIDEELEKMIKSKMEKEQI